MKGLFLANSLRGIAKEIGCHHSSVSREIRKSGFTRKTYSALEAHMIAIMNSAIPKKPVILENNKQLMEYVIHHLIKDWSPEQIAERIKEQFPNDSTMRIHPETIYRYVYIHAKPTLRKELKKHLRQQKKYRGNKSKNGTETQSLRNMTIIDDRPKEIEDRLIPGHWEGDLLEGYHHSCIGVLTERTTRYVLLCMLQGKDAVTVRKAFQTKINLIPKSMRKTLTYDQGKEMAEHERLAKKTRIKVFFTHPHSPWEKGSVENMNGLLRQYFPKGMNLRNVNVDQLKKVEKLLNGRPRKCLNWRTPQEVFSSLLVH